VGEGGTVVVAEVIVVGGEVAEIIVAMGVVTVEATVRLSSVNIDKISS